jgi:hypothetical protein
MARVTHAAPPSLEESMSLMEELCRLYSCDEDQLKIRELRATRAQVEHVMRQREDHMAQLLQGVPSRARAVERPLTLTRATPLPCFAYTQR